MKIFVTGGTGFIGSTLVQSLLKDGHDIIMTGCKVEIEIKGVVYLDCHLNGVDYSRLNKVDACFHLAANNDTIVTDRTEMFRANVEAPKDLFERLMNDHDCKRIVYASSASIYGNSLTPFTEDSLVDPLSLYAESKLAFDEWVMQNDFPALGLRYTNVYGPNESHKTRRASMITQIIQKVKNQEVIKLFKNGEQRRDWVYVKDVVSMNKAGLDSDCRGIINCGSGEAITFNEVVESICEIMGVTKDVEYIDSTCPFNFQVDTTVSLDKAKFVLGYKPQYTFEQGIKDIYAQVFN